MLLIHTTSAFMSQKWYFRIWESLTDFFQWINQIDFRSDAKFYIFGSKLWANEYHNLIMHWDMKSEEVP